MSDSPIKDTLFRRALKVLDYIIVPFCILLLAYDPNFIHGQINFFECGQYLSYVNGLFHGKIPARDFLVLFGPLQVYAIAGVMLVFGKTLAVLRTYFYVLYLFGFLVMYLLGRQVCKTRLFMYLIGLACLVEVAHPYWGTRWDFGRYALGLLILIALILYSKKGSLKTLFAIGLLSGFALFYSIDVGVMSIFSAAVFLAALSYEPDGGSPKYDLRTASRGMLLYGAGIAFIALPVLIFTFYKGGFLNYLKTMFIILPSATFKVWGQPIPSFFNWFLLIYDPSLILQSKVLKIYIPVFFYAGTLAYLAFSFVKKRWDREKAVVLLLFVYGVFIYRMSFRSIEGPQFQVALPPLIVLAALFLEKGVLELRAIIANLRGQGHAPVKGGLVKAALISIAVSIAALYFIVCPRNFFMDLPGWFSYQANKGKLVAFVFQPRDMALQRLVISDTERAGKVGIPEWQKRILDGVVRYVSYSTREDEEVFTFPDQGAYNFFAGRPSFSRFYTSGTAWTCPEWTKELLDELDSKKPGIIVFGNSLSNMAMAIGRNREVLPEVIDYIVKHYRLGRQYIDVLVLIRKNE